MLGVQLTPREQELIATFTALKAEAGSHSPSVHTLRDRMPDVAIKVDACFLSNPYATELFLSRLERDLVATGALRDVLEFYPSQNAHVAALLEEPLGIPREQIFVCNGAVEAIQAALHRFGGSRVALPIPTFSPYYEYLGAGQEAVFYRLERERDFELDVDDFIAFVERERADTVCLINPNNPNGGFVPSASMRKLLKAFAELPLVILDESFVDFAYEDEQLSRLSLAAEAAAMPNVMVVKSMSKDFGIAGIRAGYAVMSPGRVRALLGNGYLWNVSGLCEFFFRLFADDSFQEEYGRARLRYLEEAGVFFEALGGIDRLRAYPTKANFCLVELEPSLPVELVAPLLLVRHGVYIRGCGDKIGLEDGEFVRIAGRTAPENATMLSALRDVVHECVPN